MSAAHTPGPWVMADGFGPSPTGTAVQATDSHLVASCTGYYGRDAAIANARLIAAAPDLHRLYRAVLAYHSGSAGPVPHYVALARAIEEETRMA